MMTSAIEAMRRPKEASPPTVGRNLIILGAGGIGGNFLSGFGVNDDFRVVAAIDDDRLELSNFNRIPLPLSNLGRPKVLSRNLEAGLDRRVGSEEEFLECMATVFNNAQIKNNPELWAHFAYRNGIVVVDSRDTSDPNLIFPEIDIKLTYDGCDACCIEFNPDYGKNDVLITQNVEQRTYSVTPSFVAPPTMLVWYTYRLVHLLPYDWYCTIGRYLEKNIKMFFSLNEIIKSGKTEGETNGNNT